MFFCYDYKYSKLQNEKLKEESGLTSGALFTHFIWNKIPKRKDKGISCNINIWFELLAIRLNSNFSLHPIFRHHIFALSFS